MNHPPAPDTAAAAYWQKTPYERRRSEFEGKTPTYGNGDPVEPEVIEAWCQRPYGPYPGYGDPRDD